MAKTRMTYLNGLQGPVVLPPCVSRHGGTGWQIHVRGYKPKYVSDRGCGGQEIFSLAVAAYIAGNLSKRHAEVISNWLNDFKDRKGFKQALSRSDHALFGGLHATAQRKLH